MKQKQVPVSVCQVAPDRLEHRNTVFMSEVCSGPSGTRNQAPTPQAALVKTTAKPRMEVGQGQKKKEKEKTSHRSFLPFFKLILTVSAWFSDIFVEG